MTVYLHYTYQYFSIIEIMGSSSNVDDKEGTYKCINVTGYVEIFKNIIYLFIYFF